MIPSLKRIGTVHQALKLGKPQSVMARVETSTRVTSTPRARKFSCKAGALDLIFWASDAFAARKRNRVPWR